MSIPIIPKLNKGEKFKKKQVVMMLLQENDHIPIEAPEKEIIKAIERTLKEHR